MDVITLHNLKSTCNSFIYHVIPLMSCASFVFLSFRAFVVKNLFLASNSCFYIFLVSGMNFCVSVSLRLVYSYHLHLVFAAHLKIVSARKRVELNLSEFGRRCRFHGEYQNVVLTSTGFHMPTKMSGLRSMAKHMTVTPRPMLPSSTCAQPNKADLPRW